MNKKITLIPALLLIGILCTGLIVHAQNPPYFKGTGTATNTIPMNTAGSHCQQIYEPTDFNTLPIAGNITKIYFRNSVAAGSGTYVNFSVGFLQNSLTTFPNSTFLTGFTNALSAASITINGNATAGGWYEIPLTTPFLYDNTQPLIVEIKYDSRTGGMSGYTTTAGGNKRLSIVAPPGPATGNLSTLWGDFGIEVVPATPCTNPPTPGNATAIPSTPICSGVPVQLNLAGNSSGSDQTYTWQSSSTLTGTYTSFGTASATASKTVNPSTTTFYRCAVQCGTGTVVYSTPVEVVVNPLFPAGVYTINSALPTSGSNFQSFTDAINALSCGIAGPITFNVANGSGPYFEQITIPQIFGASATNRITFNGNGQTLSFNSTATASRAGITLNGADYITIDSLLIDGQAGTYGWGIHLYNGADFNIIRKCTINVSTSNTTSVAHAGIVMSGSTSTATTSGNNGNNNLFSGNTLIGGYYAACLYGNSATPLLGNVFSNNIVQDAYSYSVYVAYQSGFQFVGNDISRPTRTSSAATGGLYFTTGNINSVIEKNRIHNFFDQMTTNTSTFYGLYILTDGAVGQENKLVNNLIYAINSNGPAYGIYNSGGDHMQAYHNTIVLDDAATTTGTAYGIYQTTAATGIDIKNNVVVVSRSGTGIKRCLHFNTTTSTITSNNNVLFMNAAAGTDNKIGQYGTVGYTALTDWQGANSNAYDQQSVSVDPVFANAAGGDYTPTVSTVNNTGTPVGVLTDIMGVTRSTTNPDAGAYEFSTLAAGLNFGAEALVSPTNSLTGCYTNAETVTVRIRNGNTATHNFVTNPVTVNVTVTGAVTQNLTRTVNTGTLASDGTLDVVFTTPLNMSVAGVYTFNATTVLTGDVNPANDAMLPVNRTKVALSGGTATATPSTFCANGGTLPTLKSTGYEGHSSLQWQQSTTAGTGYTNIASATTVPYTVTTALTQNRFYRLVATCGSETSNSSEAPVVFENPTITSTSPATRCGTGTVTLGATASAGATISWYANATGGAPLTTGNSFTTPSITTTTTYYAAAGSGTGGTSSAGLLNAVSTSGYTLEAGLFFDALVPFTLAGVNVYPIGTGAGTAVIALQDGTGTTLQSLTANLTGTAAPYTKTYVPLNFTVPAGTNLRLVMLSRAGLVSSLIRESGTAVYPYTLPGVLTITSGKCCPDAVSTTSYYYFYDWQVVTGCESPRTAVTATVDNNPGCTPTPVTLFGFRGEKQSGINKLYWNTSSEVNNKGFELQRSADGVNFSSLGFIATKAINGNSNSNLSYSYDDVKPLLGNGYYRLKQIDADGKSSYSTIVLLKGDKQNNITITGIYPNPVRDKLNIIITTPTKEEVTMVVSDMSGKVLLQQRGIISTGDNAMQINTQTLATGTYVLKLRCANGCEAAVQKFVKQ